MHNQDNDESKAESLNVLIGLLDFDSDRATTHASFVVASIFGIYSVLFSFQNYFSIEYGKIVFIITYLSLSIIAGYSFLNFSKYSSRASAAEFTMENYFFKHKEIRDYYVNLRDGKNKSALIDCLQKPMKSKS